MPEVLRSPLIPGSVTIAEHTLGWSKNRKPARVCRGSLAGGVPVLWKSRGRSHTAPGGILAPAGASRVRLRIRCLRNTERTAEATLLNEHWA